MKESSLFSLITHYQQVIFDKAFLSVSSAGIIYWLQLHMADSEHSSSGNTYVDSREETIEESKRKFSEDEETLIIRMYNLVGERWAIIAGRIPGRTAEEIEEYWNTRYSTSTE
ncbi:MYB-like transcription factor ETC1 isoform X2 [Durio zibethinus]|uniref:MYB-like transcription factor ETC1 isoform X2 n=1 Tax=Durio zibethinus TaxID=66656 RepID=A0A6P5WWS0_DURZI|nr:MYB-like transcription factor ETC1 isoform X2 [Durio zibethinus]XP_022720591.1 MYB-like transcription factor ETC1 isoform X2 [Durio zibethinus]